MRTTVKRLQGIYLKNEDKYITSWANYKFLIGVFDDGFNILKVIVLKKPLGYYPKPYVVDSVYLRDEIKQYEVRL